MLDKLTFAGELHCHGCKRRISLGQVEVTRDFLATITQNGTPKEAFFVDEGLSGIIMGHQAHYPGKEHTNYSLYMKHGFGGKFELGTIHVATRPTGELTMTIADMGEHPKPWGMLLIRMGRDQKEIQEPGMKKKRPGGERE